jgi:hypothetical protein
MALVRDPLPVPSRLVVDVERELLVVRNPELGPRDRDREEDEGERDEREDAGVHWPECTGSRDNRRDRDSVAG